MRKLSLLLFFAAIGSYAQQQPPVTPTAPCVIPFFINSTGTGANGRFQPSQTGFDNRQSGCSNWSLQYSSTGYTVISIQLESAPPGSNNAPGTPGTYVIFAGTVASGINPNTSITQAASTFTGYFPWIRVNALTLTGTGVVVGVLIGTQPIPVTGGGTTGGGCAGTVATPCVVQGPAAFGAASAGNPVWVAGTTAGGVVQPLQLDVNGGLIPSGTLTTLLDGIANTAFNFPNAQVSAGAGGVQITNARSIPYAFNGSTWDRQFLCTLSTPINISTTGENQIIALSGSTIIRVCDIQFTAASAENVKFSYGTGVNCAGGTVDLTGLFNQVTNYDHDFQGRLRTAAGNAFCISLSGNISTQGVVTYAQF